MLRATQCQRCWKHNLCLVSQAQLSCLWAAADVHLASVGCAGPLLCVNQVGNSGHTPDFASPELLTCMKLADECEDWSELDGEMRDMVAADAWSVVATIYIAATGQFVVPDGPACDLVGSGTEDGENVRSDFLIQRHQQWKVIAVPLSMYACYACDPCFALRICCRRLPAAVYMRCEVSAMVFRQCAHACSMLRVLFLHSVLILCLKITLSRSFAPAPAGVCACFRSME